MERQFHLRNDAVALAASAVHDVVLAIERCIDEFVKWPTEGTLLWDGCIRQPYHTFPIAIKSLAKQRGVTLDSRSNGPAVVAYHLNGGKCPTRRHANRRWSVHHIYDGLFPFPGRVETLHAVKDGSHFTHSAGLVALHPIADAVASEFDFFAWFLREEAYLRFGYDPDQYFLSSPRGITELPPDLST